MHDSLDEEQSLNVEDLQLFSQARAVSALSLAGGEDSLMAATEAIYEASSAVDDGTQEIGVRPLFYKAQQNYSLKMGMLV
ncbi:hypothetical protein [Pseudomonas sp. 1 R 17]|uniref:hypothetical protein n=1 Tax=Pseudomonas sp. 1 R 17 TaxID=1844091 RepID=UPI0011471523|nr:hypothetical protein [Pseudomonas sp. 1 R 17]